jgi:hypothetical protein
VRHHRAARSLRYRSVFPGRVGGRRELRPPPPPPVQ